MVTGCVELPRLRRLLPSAAWSLGEAIGLPVGVCLGVGALAGTLAGVVAGVAAVWLAVGIRKLSTGKVPGLLMISAVMLCLQAVLVLMTGQPWIYLLQFPAAKLILSVLFARSARTADPLVARLAAEVASVRHSGAGSLGLHHFYRGATWLWAGLFAMLAVGFAVLVATQPMAACLIIFTAATAGAVGAGVVVSVLWFRAVLRRHGLRFRFAAA